MEMSFRELTERWEKAEGSTMKATTLHHYKNALRAYILPKFGERKITEINREDIQTFLGEKARKYSESTLRSMRVLGLTLGWATNCSWLERNPCSRVKLPKHTGGRRVTRTVLTAEQANAIAEKLKEHTQHWFCFLQHLDCASVRRSQSSGQISRTMCSTSRAEFTTVMWML
jgi:integrase